MARGTANQVLKVNSGGTDLEWGAVSGTWDPAATETLTNKTVNATNNTITDTSIAAGDLFKGNGTKFVRFAKGTANQLLRVNAGATDIEYFTQTSATETLTNKTVNATNNTITDTSQAAGDLLKNNGTKFVRFPRGAASQVLRTNAAATDLEWADVSGAWSPSSSETLSNKTISATSNTITDTSIATGDIMRSNGTKFVRFARGTSNQVLKTNSAGTDIEWGTTTGSEPPYTYIIYRDGANTVAYSKNLTNYSSTNANTVFKAVGTAMQNAGGGMAFIKNGEYIIPDGESPVDQIENTVWVGEDRDKVIIRHQNTLSGYGFIHRIGLGNVPTIKMYNMTLQTETNSQVLYLGGSKDSVFYNCVFKRTITPSVETFTTFFDDVSKTRTHQNMWMEHCYYMGDTGNYPSTLYDQDMFGSGEMYNCHFNNNVFIGSAHSGQGYGVTTQVNCEWSENHFINMSNNPIGFENVTQGATVHDNKFYNCKGALKMSTNIANELSKGNSIIGNKFYYGDSRIEDFAASHDIIANNTFYRTKTYGIVGAFDRCIITGNQFVQTNYSQSNLGTILSTGGASYFNGGIVSANNPNFTSCDMSQIHNNHMYSAGGATFTIPAGLLDGGTTVEGKIGGIILDTSSTSTDVYNNNLWHTYSKVIKLTNTGKTYGNTGYITENKGTATIPSGALTTNINHGLSYTPQLQDISVTPTNNPTTDPAWFYITNPTSSQFTLSVKTNPSTSGATFVWKAGKDV
jgi:hypothetical protein